MSQDDDLFDSLYEVRRIDDRTIIAPKAKAQWMLRFTEYFALALVLAALILGVVEPFPSFFAICLGGFAVTLLVPIAIGRRVARWPLIIDPDGGIWLGDRLIVPAGQLKAIRYWTVEDSEHDVTSETRWEMSDGRLVKLPWPCFVHANVERARVLAERLAKELAVPLDNTRASPWKRPAVRRALVIVLSFIGIGHLLGGLALLFWADQDRWFGLLFVGSGSLLMALVLFFVRKQKYG